MNSRARPGRQWRQPITDSSSSSASAAYLCIGVDIHLDSNCCRRITSDHDTTTSNQHCKWRTLHSLSLTRSRFLNVAEGHPITEKERRAGQEYDRTDRQESHSHHFSELVTSRPTTSRNATSQRRWEAAAGARMSAIVEASTTSANSHLVLSRRASHWRHVVTPSTCMFAVKTLCNSAACVADTLQVHQYSHGCYAGFQPCEDVRSMCIW